MGHGVWYKEGPEVRRETRDERRERREERRAKWHGTRAMKVEKPSLARAVYRGVAVNRPIPAEHYTAVAEVLTEVYQRDAGP